jgi:restriction system protein
MPIPDYQECMLPLLKLASDGKDHRIREAIQAIADEFKLSDEERRELLPSGGTLVIASRVGWARTYLKKAGLLEDPKRGYFRITDRGRSILKSKPPSIDTKFLRQFEEFRSFQKPDNSDTGDESENFEKTDQTPEEMIATGYKQIRTSLSGDLIEQVRSSTPAFFEKLVVQLLVAMGYGGNFEEAATVLGKSRDEGIDGIINEDKLGLDVIYIQAKRWEQPVGRPEIQKFAGALLGKKAKKGVFITTSSFSSEARSYANNIESRIILIDGARLTELMIQHDIGVSTYATYDLKRIDTDFFIEG